MYERSPGDVAAALSLSVDARFRVFWLCSAVCGVDCFVGVVWLLWLIGVLDVLCSRAYVVLSRWRWVGGNMGTDHGKQG